MYNRGDSNNSIFSFRWCVKHLQLHIEYDEAYSKPTSSWHYFRLKVFMNSRKRNNNNILYKNTL